MRLHKKVAIITGAASGIGRETAILFAKEGAIVIGTDIQQDLLDSLEKEDSNIHGYILDVTDRAGISKFVEEIKSKFGKIDILINNAGITSDALLIRMTEEAWDKVININLKGVFNMTQAVVQVM
ncbi:MAG: SDR family NAD(P)-dependent oxidoreductase, partial [Exilispira sp.]